MDQDADSRSLDPTPADLADLKERVVLLERTVRSIGEVLACGLALGPACIAAYIVTEWLHLPTWAGTVTAVVAFGMTGAVFWGWYGRDLRP
jgi:hypothetical protein